MSGSIIPRGASVLMRYESSLLYSGRSGGARPLFIRAVSWNVPAVFSALAESGMICPQCLDHPEREILIFLYLKRDVGSA
jgi:hypothetical protein